MKIYFVALLSLLLSQPLLAAKKSKGKMVTIQGVVTQTRDYCGGAAPGPDQLENLSRPVPLPEKELYIRIGTRNKPSRSGQSPIYKKVITNAKGEFSVSLKSNTTYCFIEGWKAKPFKVPANTQFTVWDAACLYEKYIIADYVIKVKPGSNEVVKINFHQRCFFNPYCGTYSGPLPP
jgi:hypothetical protein